MFEMSCSIAIPSLCVVDVIYLLVITLVVGALLTSNKESYFSSDDPFLPLNNVGNYTGVDACILGMSRVDGDYRIINGYFNFIQHTDSGVEEYNSRI